MIKSQQAAKSAAEAAADAGTQALSQDIYPGASSANVPGPGYMKSQDYFEGEAATTYADTAANVPETGLQKAVALVKTIFPKKTAAQKAAKAVKQQQKKATRAQKKQVRQAKKKKVSGFDFPVLY